MAVCVSNSHISFSCDRLQFQTGNSRYSDYHLDSDHRIHIHMFFRYLLLLLLDREGGGLKVKEEDWTKGMGAVYRYRVSLSL